MDKEEGENETKRIIRELGNSQVRGYSRTDYVSALAHLVWDLQKRIKLLEQELSQLKNSLLDDGK